MKYRYTTALALLLFTFNVFGKCIYFPSHTFDFSVEQCNAITIGAGTLKSPYGGAFDIQNESVSGVILTGDATNNKYDWEGNIRIKDFEGWNHGSYKSVIVMGDAKTVCNGERGFSMKLKTIWPCCDVLPLAGYCFIPGTITYAAQQ